MALGPAADNTPVRVGLMGGTFDPPHYGHLLLAEQAREQLALARVVFLPCGQPPHKRARRLAPPEHRLAMTELACADNPAFAVSRLELDRPGPSYTLDTVRAFRAELGPAAQLFLLTGMDQVLELPTWHEPEALLAEVTLVAAPRPGYDAARLAATLGEAWASQLVKLEMPLVGLSSTDLRERARRGASLRYLVPSAVESYLRQHRLYPAE